MQLLCTIGKYALSIILKSFHFYHFCVQQQVMNFFLFGSYALFFSLSVYIFLGHNSLFFSLSVYILAFWVIILSSFLFPSISWLPIFCLTKYNKNEADIDIIAWTALQWSCTVKSGTKRLLSGETFPLW